MFATIKLDQLPFASVGKFPPDRVSDVNVYIREAEIRAAVSPEEAASAPTTGARFPDAVRQRGNVGDAIDFYAGNTIETNHEEGMAGTTTDNNESLDADVPFERQSFSVKPGYDARLRYITLHCTGPGVMGSWGMGWFGSLLGELWRDIFRR